MPVLFGKFTGEVGTHPFAIFGNKKVDSRGTKRGIVDTKGFHSCFVHKPAAALCVEFKNSLREHVDECAKFLFTFA